MATGAAIGRLLLVTVFASCLLASPRARGEAKRPTEEEKIKRLISTVENLKDATFVRNGQEHSAKDAADHMRRKWKSNESSIKSARAFIRVAASKSGISGKPYLIRMKDKSEVTSEAFLTKELEKIEKEGAKG